MINVVFEGIIDSKKNKIIKKVKSIYSLNHKVGYNEDITSKLIINDDLKKYLDNELLNYKDEEINILKKDMLKKVSNYILKREKIYKNNNDINLFKHSYFSYYVYYSILLNNQLKNSKEIINKILDYLKVGEKNIDLLIFFRSNISSSIKLIENKKKRRASKDEIKLVKLYDKKVTDYIRYNNSEYKLLVIDIKDSYEDIIKKIVNKIDELIEDKIKTEDEKWYELYKIDIEEFEKPDDYIEYKLKYKKRFVKKIIQYASNNKVIEMGCGTGLVAGYLAKFGLDVTALDLSNKVLEYAERIANQSSIISPCKYEQGDILNLKYAKDSFDVSYSNGVLEHFNDEEIIKTLKQQMELSNYVIFGIPSTYFNMNEKMLGNERGLKLKEWKNLINQANGEIIEQTSFHYYKLHRRIFEIKKWFKPKAFWLFVIKRKN